MSDIGSTYVNGIHFSAEGHFLNRGEDQCIVSERLRMFFYKSNSCILATRAYSYSFESIVRNSPLQNPVTDSSGAYYSEPYHLRLKFVQFLNHLVILRNNDILVLGKTGARRNRVSADDILLEAFKMIDAGANSGFAEDLGGLLE